MLFLLVLFIIGIVIFLMMKNKIDKRIVVEGVIIGVVSGLIISYITDVNFQANVNGPVIKIARVFNKQLRYVSKEWGNIKAEVVNDNMVSVSASNIASGVTVTYQNTPLSKLPADLRYAVSTGDIAANKTFINIISPDVENTDAAHTVGGIVVKRQ